MNRLFSGLFFLAILILASCTSGNNINTSETLHRQWMLKTLPGAGLEELVNAKATINLSDKKNATAYAGCNRIFFTVKTGGKNEIGFLNIGATKMYCEENMKIEDALLKALPLIKAYELKGHQIIFKDAHGKALITAVAADWD